MNASISSHFAIIEPSKVRDYIRMQPLNFLPVGTQEYMATGKISFNQTPEDGESGLSYNQELSLITQNRDVARYAGCRKYLAFFMSDGSLRMIGTPSTAPLLKITPHEGAYRLEVSFRSPEPLPL